VKGTQALGTQSSLSSHQVLHRPVPRICTWCGPSAVAAVVGNDAIVRHARESDSGTGDGKWNVPKIGVLQVWQKQTWGSRLLVRQAFEV
jgi:hypothetical protein